MSLKYEGTKILLGGEDMVVPSLNFRSLRLLGDHLANLSTMPNGLPTPSHIESVVLLLHAAIVRNYPDYTRETLEENLDLSNMSEIISAVMGVSGMAQLGKQKAAEGN